MFGAWQWVPTKSQIRRDLLSKTYSSSPETDRIWLDHRCFIDFSLEFTYLGSIITFDLIDNGPDIDRRIKKASQSMGMLNNLWNNDFLDLTTKKSFFLAIPVNLLLWDCESWALKESDYAKLDAFLHRSARQILRIKMSTVREERIRNEQVRKMFQDLLDIRSMVAARQLHFVSKTVRQHPDPEHIPKQLLAAWVNTIRENQANPLPLTEPQLSNLLTYFIQQLREQTHSKVQQALSTRTEVSIHG